MDERNRVLLETILDMLGRGDLSQAITTVSGLHSADAAEVLSNLGIEDEVAILIEMDARTAARALLEMAETHQVDLASALKEGQLYDLLESMPVDEAVDLLGDIPEDRRRALLHLFKREEAGELEELLTYGDESAGGLMTPDYLSVRPQETVDEVIEKLRAVDPEIETIYYVYVVSREGLLEGVLSLRELITSPPGRSVERMMSTDIITVSPEEDQEDVAEVISKYDLLAVPVTDQAGGMMGIVTVDDVMDVIDEEAREDIMKFAGATGVEEPGPKGLFANFTRRLPWFLVAAVIEVLIAGGIIKLYSPVLEEFIVLVFFIPLLVTMGGNIAVQSSTIMAYSVSGGKPLFPDAVRAVFGEVTWGVLVGLITGGAIAILSMILDLEASVGLVVGLSLAITVVVASVVGCAMPLVLRALDRDFSAVSGPLVGTTMDVLSLAVYLVIGTVLI